MSLLDSINVFNEFRQVFDADKIYTILTERGYKVSSKFVASVMREMELSSVRTTAKQNQAQATCLKKEKHYCYICVILHLFFRMVIAHKSSRKNSVQLITATFKMAVIQHKSDAGLVFHSDHRAQYTSHRFQQLLHDHAVKQPFSNSRKPHDNAVPEAFFASLKKRVISEKLPIRNSI